jgi:DNA-binding CsgD family transcriptional regulator
MHSNGGPLEAYRVAVQVLQRVAAGDGSPLSRLTDAVDVVVPAVGADLGLVVHGGADGWDVRRIGTHGLADLEVSRPILRVVPRADPLLGPVRGGDDRVTTMGREVGPGWLASPRCSEVRRVWGIDQLARVPIRTGTSFVSLVLGRLGEDYSDADLLVLSILQPVLVALNRILDPEEMPDPTARVVHLTPREQLILSLLSQGYTAARIAHQNDISPRTVHHHLANIYAKLGVGDRLSAVNRGRSLGLLDVPPTRMEVVPG